MTEQGWTDIDGSNIKPSYLRLSFEPVAVREHFDDCPNEDITNALGRLTDEQLARAALDAMSADRLYELFGELCVEIVEQAR